MTKTEIRYSFDEAVSVDIIKTDQQNFYPG